MRALVGPWRFALDEIGELSQVEAMMRILVPVKQKRKRVYVLIGNEPIEQCYERAQKVLEWGGEPFCQPVIALNSLDRRPLLRHDWTETLLRDFARYYNRFLWKYLPLADYNHRKGEAAPFAAVV